MVSLNKQEDFKNTILYKIDINEIGHDYYFTKEDILNSISPIELNKQLVISILEDVKPILDNPNLIISTVPIIRYEEKVYAIEEINSIEDITNFLNENRKVILYAPILIDKKIKFKTKII